ncbi:hypothetical protein [Jiella pelagia]|uniref:Uncharacterized protein n=1 Tax=Jiella pelagia TaxID=2986949 RepID=A0ABY7C4B8_9HYPH|nr:hypothetical protein [Jiella pelagia]WAP70921.1 hypothetical protein OH818_13680 [Jiella pelagia]
MSLSIEARPIDRESFMPASDAVVVKLGKEFEGAAKVLGDRLAAAIQGAIRKCGISEDDGLSRVTYHDRFTRSPLVLKLLIDTIASLAKFCGVQGDDSLGVDIMTAPDKGSLSPRHEIISDIEKDEDLAALAACYGDRRDLDVKLLVGQPAHKCSLRLNLKSEKHVIVDLDQGFGWMHYRGDDRSYDQR